MALPIKARIQASLRQSGFARASKQLQAQACQWRQGHCSRTGLGERLSRTISCLPLRRPATRALVSPSAVCRSLSIFSQPQAHVPVAPVSETQDTNVQSIYRPPTSGVLSYLPASWVPYAELARYDKRSGSDYLFFPCLFGTLMAAPLTLPITAPSTVIATSLLFYAGAVVMRGAGCTVNDLWDRNLDPHVTRTRLRPLARGALTPSQAVPFLGVQLLTGLAILLQFPSSCFFYATPSLLLVGLYPLAKRVTNYPQFVLGLTFSWGTIVGFPALGLDLLASTPHLIAAGCLYGSCVAWTLVYDMIYAYQDIRDDPKAGIKSIALAQAKHPKTFLSTAAAVQVALLAGAGLAGGAGPIYFAGACGGAALTLGNMIRKVDLNSVKDCWAWFKKGAWLTGGAISLGLFTEYLAHYLGWYGNGADEDVSSQK